MFIHSVAPEKKSIEIVESFGEWFVRIAEGGGSTVHTFESHSFALAFAEEERARLGVEHIGMIEDGEQSPVWLSLNQEQNA
jgi:hypothetical protein